MWICLIIIFLLCLRKTKGPTHAIMLRIFQSYAAADTCYGYFGIINNDSGMPEIPFIIHKGNVMKLFLNLFNLYPSLYSHMQNPTARPCWKQRWLIAAIDNGADAVYFGGQVFSARQYASNFSARSWNGYWLSHVVASGHMLLLHSHKGFRAWTSSWISSVPMQCRVDAVIVQDLGILKLLREQLPEFPVHASTQMTIHNVEGVKFMQDMGVKRIVLSREMSLDEIKRIKTGTVMEIETFIHGALCFSYSGQCS